MKFNYSALLFLTSLLLHSAKAQTVLYFENFESGGNFTLNTTGVGSNTGSNQWIINNSYTGGGVYPSTINEDSTFGGNISYAPYGHYLHIYDVPSTYTNCNYNPANQSDRFAYLTNGICTLGTYSVSVNFFYLCQGSANAYGTVYYSRNNGPWIQCGAAQYNSKYKWQYATITNPNFDDASSLQIGFRWQNNAGAGNDTSAFAIDDISIAGTYDSVNHPVHITPHVSPDTICAGGGSSINLYWVTSDTLCDGTYSIIMSDSTGNFANAQLGWTASMYWPQDTSFTYNLLIPATIPSGHCYKFRVDRTTFPAITGIVTGCVYIQKCPTTITTLQPLATSNASQPICAGSVIQVPFNSNGTYAPTNVYTAELSDSSGSFVNYTTIGFFVSNSAYPSIPGIVSGQIPFNVPAGCHYYIRVVSDTPKSIGTPWGPFCIQHCDIWSDTTSTSLQACVKSCYKDPTGFSFTIPYKIHKYDNNEHYTLANQYKVQLLSTQTFSVVATGSPFGAITDSLSGNITVHIPCGDSLCNVVNVQPGLYYMRLIATNASQPDSVYGTLAFLTIGYPMDSLKLIPSPNANTFCVGDIPNFYAYPYNGCTNNWNNSTYTWYINNIKLNQPPFTQFNIGLILNTVGTTTLMVKETNNGCTGPMDTLLVKAEGIPSVSITGPTIICKGDTAMYSAPFANNTYYKWNSKYFKFLDTANNVAKIVFDTLGTFNLKIFASDSCGTDSATKRIMVKICNTGFASISNPDELVHIYPNPNNGEFNLSLGQMQNVSVKVTDVLGQVIYSENYGNISSTVTKQVNLPGASKGVYLLQVTSNYGIVNKKVIVQ